MTDSDGTKKPNVSITRSMTNVLNMVGSVSFTFTNSCHTFHAKLSSKETAKKQHLTLKLTHTSGLSTGSFTFELQDLRPSPSEPLPRRVGDSTTVVIGDSNKIASGSQNEGSSLVRSLFELK
jgi:hypothetical protein